jgi:hypothetical protein
LTHCGPRAGRGLDLLKHPEKTFIGRIETGFEFLGNHGSQQSLTGAAKAIEQFVAHAIRLYEQKPGEALASARLGLHVQRWLRWALGGVRRDGSYETAGGDLGRSTQCRGAIMVPHKTLQDLRPARV